jgi:hypothetical protein
MLAIKSTKKSRVIAVVFTLAIVGSYGLEYSRLKTSTDVTLARLALVNTGLPLGSYMAETELHRKIRSGESDGSDALYHSLMLAFSEHVNTAKTIEFADELLTLGIDLDAATPYGGTLLHQAVLMNHPEIVIYLLERCADPSVQMTWDGTLSKQRTALEYAYYLESKFRDKDYSGVIEALENPNLAEKCTYGRRS